jgi:hypothetical protein
MIPCSVLRQLQSARTVLMWSYANKCRSKVKILRYKGILHTLSLLPSVRRNEAGIPLIGAYEDGKRFCYIPA